MGHIGRIARWWLLANAVFLTLVGWTATASAADKNVSLVAADQTGVPVRYKDTGAGYYVPAVTLVDTSGNAATGTTTNTAQAVGNYTVGGTATAVPTTALTSRRSMVIVNNGTATCYVGPATVTTANGLPVYPNGSWSAAYGPAIATYVICASAGQDIRVQESS